MSIDSVYLDCHSTTPIDPVVLKKMIECYQDDFGNAGSSQHFWGQDAAELVEEARQRVASLVGFQEDEVIFTSGATEANNLAIIGLASGLRSNGDTQRNEIVSVSVEHPSVLEPLQKLEVDGWKVRFAKLKTCESLRESDSADLKEVGKVCLEDLEQLISEKTALVSIAYANNEIGVVQPIEKIGEIAHRAGAIFHCDATQGVGWLKSADLKQHAELVSFSGHKIYGPKGVGALCVNRSKLERFLKPVLHGGGQEFGFRSGTLNTPGIVGLGWASSLTAEKKQDETDRVKGLRDLLWQKLSAGIEGLKLNGPESLEVCDRLPNNLNVQLPGLVGDTLITTCRNVALSSGSACATAHQGPSHVLKAIGLDYSLAECSLRIGLGRFHSEEEILWAANRICESYGRLTGRV